MGCSYQQTRISFEPTQCVPAQVGILIVAHGMGCRLVAEALGAAAAAPGKTLRCIFAAPDVAPDRFLQRLSAFPTKSR